MNVLEPIGRWTPGRKEEVLRAIRRAPDPAPILAVHGLTPDEVASWDRRFRAHGQRGLKQGRIQETRA